MPTSKRLILDYSLLNTPIKAMQLETEFEQAKLIGTIRSIKDIESLQIVAISLVESSFKIREAYKQVALSCLPKP